MQRDVTPAKDLASFRANLSRRLDILNPPPASTRGEAAAWRRRLRMRSHGTGTAPCQRGAAPGSWQPLPCPEPWEPRAAGAIAPTRTPRGPGKRCRTAELVLAPGPVRTGKGSRWEPPERPARSARSTLIPPLPAPGTVLVHCHLCRAAPQVAWLGIQCHPKTKREGRTRGAEPPPPARPGREATRPTPFGKGHRTPTAVLNASGQRRSRRGPAGRAAAGSHARDKENRGAGETSSERHRRLGPPRDPGTHPPCAVCKCQAASPWLCRAGCWRCWEAVLPALGAGEAASRPRDGQKAGKTWPPHLQAQLIHRPDPAPALSPR